ncbi:MAG: hypothetical protein ACTSU2_06435 [Promethearchaeota archaeon]
MKELNLIEIEKRISAGEYHSGLNELFELLIEENETHYNLILNTIENVLNKYSSVNLTSEQIERIKEFITSKDEIIQETAMDIYSAYIGKAPELIGEEFTYCIELLKTNDPLIRRFIIEIFINYFSYVSNDYKKSIVNILLNGLQDDYWANRLEIIEFYIRYFEEYSDLFKDIHLEFEKYLDEIDIDISRELTDLFYKIVKKHYSHEEFANLIKSIKGREWPAQEKILTIVGIIAYEDINKIKELRKDIVNYLDHDDYLVQKKTKSILMTILSKHPNFFDEIFFEYINKDLIDNIEDIEDLVIFTIREFGVPRFLTIFEQISPLIISNLQFIRDIIKKLLKIAPKLFTKCVQQLTSMVIEQEYDEDFIKLKDILSYVKNYNFQLIVYEYLSSQREIKDIKKIKNKKNQSINENTLIIKRNERIEELINLLLRHYPTLGYLKLSIWIKEQLKYNPIPVDTICQQFNIEKEEFFKILQLIMEKNLINIRVVNDKIYNIHDREASFQIKRLEHINVLRKWQITLAKQSGEVLISLLVKIENISEQVINHVSLMIEFPKDSLVPANNDFKTTIFLDNLEPSKNKIFSWKFKPAPTSIRIPKAESVKLVILYMREKEFYTIEKIMDLLIF